jgi:ribosome-associated heat shock protein Hsp15
MRSEMSLVETVGSVRIDRFLVAARIFKTRTHAQEACSGGHVEINGKSAKSSSNVRVGDRVHALAPRGRVVLVVQKLEEKRQSPDARTLYLDESPPPPQKDETVALRELGTGRPTKLDRRRMERFRGGF